MIALLRQVADPGDGEGAQWAGMRIHRIASDVMTELGSSSKLNAEWDILLACCATRAARAAEPFSTHTATTSASARRSISTSCCEGV